MEGYLYRYISFESFVGMIQNAEAESRVYKIPRKQKDNKYTNFFRNFKFFYERATELSDSQLNKFAKTLTDSCEVIEIKSWQVEQAITMFNSLNSDGLPLYDADIISAKLYAELKSAAEKLFSETSTYENAAARAEAERIACDDSVKGYNSAEELLAELNM